LKGEKQAARPLGGSRCGQVKADPGRALLQGLPHYQRPRGRLIPRPDALYYPETGLLLSNHRRKRVSIPRRRPGSICGTPATGLAILHRRGP